MVIVVCSLVLNTDKIEYPWEDRGFTFSGRGI
jgi:hypothetical protein